MLGHIVAQKKAYGRKKPRISLVPPPSPANSKILTSPQPNDKKVPPKKSTAHPRKTLVYLFLMVVVVSPQNRILTIIFRRRAVQDVSNHKITEYYPVRRSCRKTGKQIEVCC